MDMVAKLLSRKNNASTIGSRSNAGSELGSPLPSGRHSISGGGHDLPTGKTSPKNTSVDVKNFPDFSQPKISPALEIEQPQGINDETDAKRS